MALFDLPLDDLRRYQPDVTAPADLSEFWTVTMDAIPAAADTVEFVLVDNSLALIDTWDVTFTGFGGTRVKGWLKAPAGAEGPLPAVVEFVGYGGGRGLSHQSTLYAQAGYAHFIMDTRGQGAGGTAGDTPDDHPSAGQNSVSGRMTQGIMNPHDYYYRRVYADAVRAVDAAAAHPLVDPRRIVVAGISQGGGIAIAAAALSPLVSGALPDVPFLQHFRRAATITDAMPYGEIGAYLRRFRHREEAVFETLSYFDGTALAALARVPALFSVALMDATCPPSTVFATFNAWGHEEKQMRVYTYNGHEGGQEFHEIERLRWLADHFAL
ncbi:MAG: acetylxylan esterase [Acidobacteria bacterium]|nr:acetylxylan esterase [Acidobacteriota bacterium]